MTALRTTSPLTFRLVRTVEALQALAPAWEALLQASGRDEPMRHPNWLLTWWRYYGEDRSLRVGLLYEGTRLVGMLPLVRRRFIYRPGLVFRRLEYLGSEDDTPGGVCSEYLGPILAAGWEETGLDAFTHHLVAGSFGPWDELVLDAMDGSVPMPARLAHAFRERELSTQLAITAEAPYLTLPRSWEAYLASLDKHRRRHLREALKNFEQWAGGSAQLHAVDGPARLPEGLTILQQLHAERWRSNNSEVEQGAFACPRFAAFHADYARQLLAAGGLRLHWLSAHGRPVAAQYEIDALGKVYFYQCGRTMDVPTGVSVGTVLLIHRIQEAIAQGRREYDFLAGPSLYKRKFTGQARPIVQLRVARATPIEKLRSLARNGAALWRHLRRIRKTKLSAGTTVSKG